MTTENEIKPAAPAEAIDGGRCAVDAGFGVWVPTAERVPANPEGFPRNDHVACLCVWRGESGGGDMRILQWNAYYKVWDDAEGDDFFCNAQEVTHWMPLPPWPNIQAQPCGQNLPPTGHEQIITDLEHHAREAAEFLASYPDPDEMESEKAAHRAMVCAVHALRELTQERAAHLEAMQYTVSVDKILRPDERHTRLEELLALANTAGEPHAKRVGSDGLLDSEPQTPKQ